MMITNTTAADLVTTATELPALNAELLASLSAASPAGHGADADGLPLYLDARHDFEPTLADVPAFNAREAS